jgi:hypothetical protein
MIPAPKFHKPYAALFLGFLAIITFIGLFSTPANASGEILLDVEKHDLPTHKLQWSDTLDVVVDVKNQNVCYVARQSDSHAMQMQCLPIRK